IILSSGVEDNYYYYLSVWLLRIEKANQSITFDPINDQVIEENNQVALEATSNSGLPVSFELNEGDGIINNNILTMNSTGQFQISAFQVGNENYLAATSVIQSFNVTSNAKADQTITFEAINDQLYGDSFKLTASSTSNLAVGFEIVDGPGLLENSTITFTGVGSVTVSCFQEGNSEFNPANPNNQTIIISKAPLTFTATDLEMQVGETIPELTYTVTGFKLVDTVDDMDELPTISTSATTESDPGNYEIIFTGGMDDHYSFLFESGNLQILDEVLGIGGDQLIKVYPNPFFDKLTIEGIDFYEVRVFSIKGERVLTSSKKEISLKNNIMGILLLYLYDERGEVVHFQKLIKQ
ncbi:unnamed protein product, partial [Chrysoparadoxa australica]